MTVALGRMAISLSSVRTRVVRSVISSTVPKVSWSSMLSPTANGRSSRIVTPAMRFWTVSWAANPSAIPAIPRPAMNGATAIPSWSRTRMAAIARSVNRVNRRISCSTPASTRRARRSVRRRRPWTTRYTPQNARPTRTAGSRFSSENRPMAPRKISAASSNRPSESDSVASATLRPSAPTPRVVSTRTVSRTTTTESAPTVSTVAVSAGDGAACTARSPPRPPPRPRGGGRPRRCWRGASRSSSGRRRPAPA